MGAEVIGAARCLLNLLGRTEPGRQGLPRAITFSSRALFDIASPALADLEIACNLQPRNRLLAALARDLGERLEEMSSGDDEEGKDRT